MTFPRFTLSDKWNYGLCQFINFYFLYYFLLKKGEMIAGYSEYFSLQILRRLITWCNLIFSDILWLNLHFEQMTYSYDCIFLYLESLIFKWYFKTSSFLLRLSSCFLCSDSYSFSFFDSIMPIYSYITLLMTQSSSLISSLFCHTHHQYLR